MVMFEDEKAGLDVGRQHLTTLGGIHAVVVLVFRSVM
jgi:hypothetical protein